MMVVLFGTLYQQQATVCIPINVYNIVTNKQTTTMSVNTNYRIKNVSVSTNGRNEIYFDVYWEGDENIDYIELRIWESDKNNCLETCAYPSHSQKITVKDFYFIKDWKSGEVNKETFYAELGIATYTDKGEELSWKVLADYKPIEIDLYYESHIFRKNVLEIR